MGRTWTRTLAIAVIETDLVHDTVDDTMPARVRTPAGFMAYLVIWTPKWQGIDDGVGVPLALRVSETYVKDFAAGPRLATVRRLHTAL